MYNWQIYTKIDEMVKWQGNLVWLELSAIYLKGFEQS
jgi:hypothetical protein